MIVKDEASTIEATLLSALPHCRSWLVLDTGSTDGTQEIVRRVADGLGVPGVLVEEPFCDFATTRNRALQLAEEQAPFVLMLSGGETLHDASDLAAFLEAEADAADGAYYLRVALGATDYDSARITRSASSYRYVGVTHEMLLPGSRGGSLPERRAPGKVVHSKVFAPPERQASRWREDLRLLKAEAERNPGDPRTAFYLAQTHECLGEVREAVAEYGRRVALGGWREEAWEARLRRARLLLRHAAGGESRHAEDELLAAYEEAPERAEPLFELGLGEYRRGRPEAALVYLRTAAAIPYPEQAHLFVDRDVYSWGVSDLIACCATKRPEVGAHYARAAAAAHAALYGRGTDGDPWTAARQDRLDRNAAWYGAKIGLAPGAQPG